jgi:uncharacterized protein YydD (DUF2326 family)
MTGTESVIAQNIAALSMAALFIWYVNKRDALMQSTFDKFSERIDKLTDALNKLQERLEDVENTHVSKRRRRS